jgi:hypothetical protein
MSWSWNEEEDRITLPAVSIGGVLVAKGSRVRLNPWPGGDIFDLALAGKSAVVEAIEQDLDNRIQIAVIVEDDPGADLGEVRQPGHRFFFKPEEIEPLDSDAADRS